MEICIQRYIARRRFSPEQRKLFDIYLFLGGIDSSPRQFGGAANLDTADMSKQEIRDASTSVAISRAGGSAKYYKPGDENWDVDFLGVLQGFIGETLLAHTGYDLSEIRQGIFIVENFLRYIATHDVCPEYHHQVKASIDFFPTIWHDLCACWEAMCCLPGEFNNAACKIYREMLEKYVSVEGERLHPGIVWSTIMHQHEPMTFDSFFRSWKLIQGYELDRQEDRTFEIVEVLPPSDAVKRQTSANNKENPDVDYPEFGSIKVRDTYIADGWAVIGDKTHGLTDDTHMLYFQANVLDAFEPGMKLRVNVGILRNGRMFIIKPFCVMPSWYVFLPQNLMINYKEPGFLPAKVAEDDDVDEAIDD